MRIQKAAILAALAAAGMLAMPSLDAAEAQPQTKCPVMGGDVNKSLYVDANGKRIYVCCPGCIDAVKANPQKYIKELEAKGLVLDKAK